MKQFWGIVKIISSITLITVLAVSFSGCSRKSSTSTKQSSATAKITIWRAADNEESFQELIKSYQQDHPNVTFEYRYNPEWEKNPDLYLEETINALATGKGPDIWSVRNDWMPAQYQKVRPAPDGTVGVYSNDTKIKSQTNVEATKSLFVPVVTDDVSLGGQVYGLPLSVDSLALYTNQTILDQVSDELSSSNRLSKQLLPEELTSIKKILANGPKDWNELVKIAPYITTKKGDSISRSAVAMGLGNNIESAPDIISTLLLQNNTQIITDDLKSAFFQNAQSSASGTETYPGQGAIKFYTNFGIKNNPWYSWNNTDFSSGARQAFMDGKVAMIFEDSTFYATLKASNIKFNFNIITMPQIDRDNPTSYANYWVETVTNNSKVSDVAWDFLSYATTTNNVTSYLSNTKRPPALISKTTDYDESANQLAVFNGQSKIARSWYKGGYPSTTDEIFRNWADSIAVGGKNVTEATNTAAGELTTLLQASSTLPTSSSTSTTTQTQSLSK